MKKTLIYSACALGLFAGQVSIAQADSFTANASVTNNYIWRGLTQTQNEVAVQGGLDYAADNGFYIGTWASNVQYAPDDNFSYEHDIYFGYAGESGGISYDVGYLYYNYDGAAEFDFAEIYGTIGFESFSLSAYVFAHTEADEVDPDHDFSFGNAYYLSADYSTEFRPGVELGFHIGYHDGDFNEAFNGVPEGYIDYNVSIAKDGFTFMVTGTDLDDVGPADGLDNDSVKFVVSYGVDFEL